VTEHAAESLIARYVRGSEPLPAQEEWALEAHLEVCAGCRARLAAVPDPGLAALVDRTWEQIAPEVAGVAPAPVGSGRLARVLLPVPALVPWTLSAVLVTVLAAFLSLAAGPAGGDTTLLLCAPVVPVLGVAAAWSRALDPMHELAATAARSGLALLLHRTALTLLLTVPLLSAASLLLGTPPLRWLLPGLVCTLVALALGSVVGVERASLAVAGGWLLAVGSPLVAGHPLALPVPVAVPLGSALAIGSVVVLAARADAFTRAGGA
jgi:hypothetical protein